MDEEKQQDTIVEEEQTNQSKRRTPWWVSILCAIATYCTLKYLLPGLNPPNQVLQDLFQMGPTAAPVMTIPFLLLAAKQLYDVDIPDEEVKDVDEGKKD
ncbi:hypothetical protein [Desulforhopalus sp. 52FAK]